MKRLILLILLLSGTVCPMCSGSTSGGYEPDPSTPSEPSDPDPETPLREGELRADGNTAGTYALITSCGYNYETPDTSGAHAEAPFQHIRQSYRELPFSKSVCLPAYIMLCTIPSHEQPICICRINNIKSINEPKD